MTVIAWDGKTLAADRQCTIGSLKMAVTKVRRVLCSQTRKWSLVGFAGDGARFGQLVKWFEDGADAEKYPPRLPDDRSVLVVITRTASGAVYIRRFESTGYALVIEQSLYADGIGADVALSAMHCGQTATQACATASSLVTGCGLGVDTLAFPEEGH